MSVAARLRAEAALLRAEAERRALALEAAADELERQAAVAVDPLTGPAQHAIPRARWRAACRAGEIIGARKVGRAYLAPRGAVLEWLSRQPAPKAPTTAGETNDEEEVDALLDAALTAA